MFLIECPYCGAREESEFSYGGEAHVARPDPIKATDEEWGDYLFKDMNTKGVYLERWVHTHGCRRWFNAARDTATNEILKVYEMARRPPAAIAKAAGRAAPAQKAAAKKAASRERVPVKKPAAKKASPKKAPPKKARGGDR